MGDYNKGKATSLRRPPEERFFRFVAKSADCWEWNGYRMKNGYGVFFPGYTVLPKPKTAPKALAHRWSFEFHRGPIPEGHEVHHLCGNRWCVKPDHMVTLPRAEHNYQPGHCAHILAVKTHCKRGHLYGPVGQRRCKECERLRYRERYKERRARS